jgi:hypothetical protein
VAREADQSMGRHKIPMSASVARQKEEAFGRFLKLPNHQAQAGRSPTLEAPNFMFRLIRESAPGKPNIDDLWAAVDLSQHNRRIRLANPDMTREVRFGLYALWHGANPNSILLLERIPPDENKVSIIGSTIILPLRQSDFSLIENGGLPVVKLGQDQICGAGEAFDVLLFDTWVIHNDYQDFDPKLFRRPKKHHGYGNVLPLRHLALFWEPSENTPLRVYAEPDSVSMHSLLERLGFVVKSRTAIGQPLLHIHYPLHGKATAENMLDRVHWRAVVAKIEECASWPLG